MKKFLLLFASVLLAVGLTQAQVIVDFQTDAGGFSDNGWGKGFKSVSKVAEPGNVTNSVLALVFDGKLDGKGDIQKDNIVVSPAQVLTYNIWLPAGTPDSLVIKLWAQDDKNWAWTEQAYLAKSLPKDKWVPLAFYLDAYRADTSHYKFDAKNNKIGKGGIEIANWNGSAADKAWTGTIYIDDVSLLGVKPVTMTDFEAGLGGFADNGWGKGFTSVAKVADPSGKSAGVMALNYNGTDKGDLQVDNVDAKEAEAIVYWVWVPTNASDSLSFKMWGQDDKNWAWTEAPVVYVKNIQKGAWYPIYFELSKLTASSAGKFDAKANKIGKMGLEIADWSSKKWAGMIYVDNVTFISRKVGVQWVLADFTSIVNGGTAAYRLEGWAPAGTLLSNIVEPGNPSNRVMNLDVKLTSANQKIALNKDILLYQGVSGKFAKEVTIDIFIPATFPKGATCGLYFTGDPIGYNWTEQFDRVVNDSVGGLYRGKWNTISYSVDSVFAFNKAAGKLDTAKAKKNVFTVGVQLFDGSASTWTGALFFDNLTLTGIEAPVSNVVSPVMSARVDTSKAPGIAFNFVRLDWADNALGTETYNIYVSESAITNLTAPGVTKIGTSVPHGSQLWAHRPWTTDGAVKNYYYAITAFDGTAETPLTTQGKAGPVAVKTSTTLKIKYDSTFATKFQLDGLDDEFATFKTNQIKPENANGPRSVAPSPIWNSASIDMNWKTTLVVDAKYLYISADVTDDQLRTATDQQAWQGDALEFYLGFYDIFGLKETHGKGSGTAAGDWRIGFNSLGQTTLAGGAGTTIPGVEATVFQKLSGDGYIVEARIRLDSMVLNKKFDVYSGLLMPCRIDGNDNDPKKAADTTGGLTRGLMAQFGGWDYYSQNTDLKLDNHWQRPQTFGVLEVVGGPKRPTGVSTENAGLPLEYRLYNNYPNPFNPSTLIRYDLKENVRVSINVYNVIGQKVATLVNEHQQAGYHSVSFNAAKFSTGVYIYTIEAGNFKQVKKMMLLK